MAPGFDGQVVSWLSPCLLASESDSIRSEIPIEMTFEVVGDNSDFATDTLSEVLSIQNPACSLRKLEKPSRPASLRGHFPFG